MRRYGTLVFALIICGGLTLTLADDSDLGGTEKPTEAGTGASDQAGTAAR